MRSVTARIRGFAIVSAIFILVVLAALGAFIVNISTNQQIGSAIDVLGVRAYQAARAGIEWGLYRVQSTAAYNFGYTSTDANLRACPAPITSFTPAATTLAGFTVTVVCTATVDPSPSQIPTPASCDPASASYLPTKCGPTIYTIDSTACNQPLAAWIAASPAVQAVTTACPNIDIATPGNLYIERRLSVTF